MTVERYKQGWFFRQNPYRDDEYGMWQVYGEDPNCDFVGPHNCPYLGSYGGTFIQVLRMAVSMSLFYTWGGGGSIKKVNPTVLS